MQPRRYGFIEHVYVAPGLRQQGIAMALVEQSYPWFAQRGVEEIEAAIWSGNEASERLARKLGFEPVRLLVRKTLS